MNVQNYRNQLQDKLFKDTGAFFAFSNKQFDKEMKYNKISKYIKIVSMGAGLYVPKANADRLDTGLDAIELLVIAKHKETNTARQIIHRAFSNFECQVSGDISDAVNSLHLYEYSHGLILKEYAVFYQECIDGGYF